MAGLKLSSQNETRTTAAPLQADASAEVADLSSQTAASLSTRLLPTRQQTRRGFALGLISSALAACGGGGGASTGNDADNNSGGNTGLLPGEPSEQQPYYEPEGPMTEKSASRFLGQASMGATDEQIARVMELGYEGWIDEQMTVSGNGSRYDWMLEHGFNGSVNEFTLLGSDQSLWFKMFTSPDTLRQRIALALSEIFVINGFGITGTGEYRNFGVAAYMDLLEDHAFGRYRNLLESITLSHQMGAFLSMRGSKKALTEGRSPDENFAREILQLFSIGLYELNANGTVKRDASGQPIETYTNDDIVGLARAFTGWDTNYSAQVPARWREQMVANDADHEPGEKNFLGMTIPAGTGARSSLQMALDHIAGHDNVGPFLAYQLIQRLVTSNPSSFYVGRVAASFNDNGFGERGDLGSVVKAILLDPEARRTDLSSPTVGKVREPMLRFSHWARSFNASDITSARDCNVADMSNPASDLGQSPMRASSVFNFFRPGFVPPNTTLGANGLVAPELQIANEVTVIGYANFMTNVIRSGLQGMQSAYLPELQLVEDPAALLDRVDLLLTAGALSDTTRSLILNTLQSLPVADDEDRRVRVNTAVLLVMVSADYLVQK